MENYHTMLLRTPVSCLPHTPSPWDSKRNTTGTEAQKGMLGCRIWRQLDPGKEDAFQRCRLTRSQGPHQMMAPSVVALQSPQSGWWVQKGTCVTPHPYRHPLNGYCVGALASLSHPERKQPESVSTLLSVARSTEKPWKGLTGGDSSRWQGLATWLNGVWSQGEKHLLTHSHIQGQKCFSKLAALHNFSFNWGLTNASLNKHFFSAFPQNPQQCKGHLKRTHSRV